MALSLKIASVAASAAMLAGGALGITSYDKSVTLTVEGQRTHVNAFAVTVSDVLKNRGIEVNERDVVAPDLPSVIEDGTEITVQYSKPVTLNIDGVRRQFYTTATTLDGALLEFKQHELDEAKLSVDRAAPLGREGLTVDVITLKEVRLTIRGKESLVSTTAATVADLLAERKVSLGPDDSVNTELDSAITADQRIVIKQVSVERKTVTEKLPFSTERVNDPKLAKGKTKVKTEGKTGQVKRTYEITTVNGKVKSKEKTSEEVVKKPVKQVLLVGTKPKATSPGGPLNLARAAQWDRIARCESGNNWRINTGNGYYGGLQFALSTWRSVNGQDFAPYPHQATREEQITVANRLYARAGFGPWSCKP